MKNKSCEGKIRYKTKVSAELDRMSIIYGRDFIVTKCKYCKWWHLGHDYSKKRAFRAKGKGSNQ